MRAALASADWVRGLDARDLVSDGRKLRPLGVGRSLAGQQTRGDLHQRAQLVAGVGIAGAAQKPGVGRGGSLLGLNPAVGREVAAMPPRMTP